MIGGAGTDDVGRHGAVAESDHEGGIDRSFEEARSSSRSASAARSVYAGSSGESARRSSVT